MTESARVVSATSRRRAEEPPGALTALWGRPPWHRPLMVVAGAMAAMAVVALIGLAVDGRTLSGAPIWLKPLKFALSLALYGVTWAWLMSLRSRPSRLLWWSGTVIAAASAVEMVILLTQVVRGRASHFNVSTPLDAALFSAMGMTVAVLWIATLLSALLLVFERLGDRSERWAIRTGVAISLVGLALGGLMIGMPSGVEGYAGAHSVGVVDGGPGLPVTGWSTEGGDLRVPHFVGMHALQVLPLFALGLRSSARRWTVLSREGVRTRLVLVAATLYAGLTAVVTWQALRGQPLLEPDGTTLAAAGALALSGAVGALWSLQAERTEREVLSDEHSEGSVV